MSWLVSAGLPGSWYFICATSSLRKVSFPIWSPRSTLLVALYVAPVGTVPLTASGIGGRPPSQTRTSTPDDVDRLVGRIGPSPLSAGRPQDRDPSPDRS